MGVTKDQVEASLTSKLNPVHLEVIDTSGGCGASFAIEIVSEQFEGKRLLERHRIVNAALEEEMKEIHALSLKKAQTPQQWNPISQDSAITPTSTSQDSASTPISQDTATTPTSTSQDSATTPISQDTATTSTSQDTATTPTLDA